MLPTTTAEVNGKCGGALIAGASRHCPWVIILILILILILAGCLIGLRMRMRMNQDFPAVKNSLKMHPLIAGDADGIDRLPVRRFAGNLFQRVEGGPVAP